MGLAQPLTYYNAVHKEIITHSFCFAATFHKRVLWPDRDMTPLFTDSYGGVKPDMCRRPRAFRPTLALCVS